MKAGLISGSDMTLEAALTKLAYVLGKQALSHQERRKLMHDNLRGELTVNLGQLALDDSQFILKVAQVIGVSTGQVCSCFSSFDAFSCSAIFSNLN